MAPLYDVTHCQRQAFIGRAAGYPPRRIGGGGDRVRWADAGAGVAERAGVADADPKRCGHLVSGQALAAQVERHAQPWRHGPCTRHHLPGGGNALGQIKFLFPNEHDVYLHDTPSKSLFSRSYRAYSHGCIRLQNAEAEELAPLTGLADAIVDLVSTGNTLKANHLVEVERIMDISSRLVVNQAALKLKQAPIRAIIDAFAGAVKKD